jgi:trehalose-6-phosphate synthase
MRQRKQLRRAVAFLNETHDRVPFDPVEYIRTIPFDQLARLVTSGQVAIARLPLRLRHGLRAWAARTGVFIP